MKYKNKILIVGLLIIATVLSACSSSEIPSQEITNIPGLESTLAVQTMVARPELMHIFVSATPTTHPTAIPTQPPKEEKGSNNLLSSISTTTRVPSLTPAPTEPVCINAAEFVQDVTIPDYSRMKSGEKFIKTWRLENIGTCPWTEDYSIVFFAGDQMSAKSPIPINNLVLPGEQIDISVNLIAPDSSGSYKGSWLFQDADGKNFGLGLDSSRLFWVAVDVKSKSERFSLRDISIGGKSKGGCGPRG
jgi:hypothetical protein